MVMTGAGTRRPLSLWALEVAERSKRAEEKLLGSHSPDSFALGIRVYRANDVKFLCSEDKEPCGKVQLPEISHGTRLGIAIDRDLGNVAFFQDGKFQCFHPRHAVDALREKELFPALMVFQDTVLRIRTDLSTPRALDCLGIDASR